MRVALMLERSEFDLIAAAKNSFPKGELRFAPLLLGRVRSVVTVLIPLLLPTDPLSLGCLCVWWLMVTDPGYGGGEPAQLPFPFAARVRRCG